MQQSTVSLQKWLAEAEIGYNKACRKEKFSARFLKEKGKNEMNPFEFSIPQNIIVGAGTLAKLPECAKKMGGTHAMILSGPTLKKMGVVDKAADSLKAAGIAADIFTDIEANPSVTTVEKATESYLASGADFPMTFDTILTVSAFFIT